MEFWYLYVSTRFKVRSSAYRLTLGDSTQPALRVWVQVAFRFKLKLTDDIKFFADATDQRSALIKEQFRVHGKPSSCRNRMEHTALATHE